MMIELNNVTLLGDKWGIDEGIGNRFTIKIDPAHAELLKSNGFPATKPFIACMGKPAIHDDVANSWLDRWGNLVKGDVIVRIKEQYFEPRINRKVQHLTIHAVKVTHRPTWDEMKASLKD